MIYNQEINFIQKHQYEILIVGGGAVELRRLIKDVFRNDRKLEIREANFDAKLF